MKKKVLFSLILAIMATMWAGTAQAQTKYYLWVAGTQVTSENCGDLSVIDGVSGTAKYDDATKTLTLENATIHSTAEKNETINSGICSGISGLTIRLVGNNTITAEKNIGMANSHERILTIMGEGKLTVKGSTTASNESYQAGISNSGTITVSGCTLEVSGGACGLAYGYWKFDRCTVRAKGSGRSNDSDAGSINALFGKPEFTDCAITTPEGTYWRQSRGGGNCYLYGADGKPVTDWVTIEKSDVTIYNFKIAGTQVTSANCNDLSVIDGVSGKVNYDHATKTLTLANATISNKDTEDEHGWEKGTLGKSAGIFNEVDGLTIRLVGNNTITSEKSIGVWNADGKITFIGDGKLAVNGSTTSNDNFYKAGILNNGSIIVRGCTLEASGGVYGLTQGGWKFDHCTVRAKGGGSSDNENAGSIGEVYSYWFANCAITVPKGTYWKNFLLGYASLSSLFSADNKVVTDWVTIEPITEYELWVAGTKVTLDNCNNLSAIDGVSGTVKYDDNTKILTLENASILNTAEEYGDGRGSGINSGIDNLLIRVIGNNTITSEKSVGVWNGNRCRLFIDGDGNLKVNGSTTENKNDLSVGILNHGTITVQGCSLEASSGTCGLAGGNWKFYRCTVRAKGGGSSNDTYAGSVSCLYKKPKFKGCAITAPDGLYWKESSKDNGDVRYSLFGADDKTVTDWITIEPITEYYDLFIAGNRVHPGNLSLNDGIMGKVMYDHATKTLTLENATIHDTERFGTGWYEPCGIGNYIDGLTIRLIGNNTIISENGAGIFNKGRNAFLTIVGDGKLTVKSSNEYDVGTIRNLGTITMSGCTVEVSGTSYGVTEGSWKFDRCSVRIKGSTLGHVFRDSFYWIWDKPKFTGCAITEPVGAYWNWEEEYGVYILRDELGNRVADWVTITPDPNAIETPTADTTAKQGIYSLSGVRLQGELNNLPKGVYIVNGRKVVKK
ncbi:hypothetical protein [Prevotella ihumii]|uniref:hypothetical protein n=1 Tax=Prevotella ihumii TaxID=1917878 RepID=UPI00117E5EE8|nr:hypothetical protein [Prevotella ihumii]